MPHATPDRFFDLIMKGGVTSGVVYPPAIHHIAREGYLHGIGGTSAGAIAACLAAAAEHYRRHHLGSEEAMAGYDALNQLPTELGESGRLLSLFAPDRSTKKLFDLIKAESGLVKPATKVGGVFRHLTKWPRLGWHGLNRNALLKPLVQNNMGLCSGIANGMERDEDRLPLTAWLSQKLNAVAGLPERGKPLTFGDLWKAPKPPALAHFLPAEKPAIDLRMITTCLTMGRPFALPMSSKMFAFGRKDMRRLFPSEVCDYLEETGEQINSDYLKQDGKLPFPTGAEMPVIVAMRMSLSFPALFTLIPLWFRNEVIDRVAKPMERAWFIDGGVTSNLPVHFFDSLLPRWPTLAINLQYRVKGFTTDRPKPPVDEFGLFLPSDNSKGAKPLPHRVDVGDRSMDAYTAQRERSEKDPNRMETDRERLAFYRKLAQPIPRLKGVLMSIFRAAQTWNDYSYITLPGYRQRVAEIWLEPNEGGLNLDMDEKVIKGLVAKGNHAGAELVKRFDPKRTDKMSWEDHRWVRMRVAMSSVARQMQDIRRGLNETMRADTDYRSMLRDDPSNDTPHKAATQSYAMKNRRQRKCALEMLEELDQLAKKLEAMEIGKPGIDDPRSKPFSAGPRPHLDLRLREPLTPAQPDAPKTADDAFLAQEQNDAPTSNTSGEKN